MVRKKDKREVRVSDEEEEAEGKVESRLSAGYDCC